MAPHSSTLAWKIPWTEEPGGLQSMGSLRVRHNWATSLSHIGRGNGNPLQCSCLENPRDGRAWWAAVYGVAQRHYWSDLAAAAASRGHLRLQIRGLTITIFHCSEMVQYLHFQAGWLRRTITVVEHFLFSKCWFSLWRHIVFYQTDMRRNPITLSKVSLTSWNWHYRPRETLVLFQHHHPSSGDELHYIYCLPFNTLLKVFLF